MLAALLFQTPRLLLLDEPTNHLDMPSVAWFADFLKNYIARFILICHDREFLNEQIARVVRFELEGVRTVRRQLREVPARSAPRRRRSSRTRQEPRARARAHRAFINRFRAQANKARAVQSRIKMLERWRTSSRSERAR